MKLEARGTPKFLVESAPEQALHIEDEDAWTEKYFDAFLSVRSDIARGDLRALYPGWLLFAQRGDLDDDDIEPPVPAGLANLLGYFVPPTMLKLSPEGEGFDPPRRGQ